MAALTGSLVTIHSLHCSHVHHRPHLAHSCTRSNIAAFATSVLDKVGVNSTTQSGRFVNILENLFSSADLKFITASFRRLCTFAASQRKGKRLSLISKEKEGGRGEEEEGGGRGGGGRGEEEGGERGTQG